MTWLLVVVIVVAAALFVTDVLPADVVSMLIMVTLIVTGLVPLAQGLSGFSNQATITVAAFFVVIRAVQKTGALTLVAQRLVALTGAHPRRFLAGLMTLSAASAAFVHATGVVGVYLPVVLESARALKQSPSRFLIPLSYAAQFGGVCTLLGTTSNLVISAVMEKSRLAPIGMFEISRLGVPLFMAGFAYLITVGWKLLPSRREEVNLQEAYGLDAYLAELVVAPTARVRDRTLADAELRSRYRITVLEILRGEQRLETLAPQDMLQVGDVLRVKATLEHIVQAHDLLGLELPPDVAVDDARRPAPSKARMVEVMVAPDSSVEGRDIRELDFRARFGVSVLALKRREHVRVTDLRSVRLRAFDTLLVQGTRDDTRRLGMNPDFIVLEKVATPRIRRRQLVVTAATLVGLVACTAANLAPLVTNAVVAAAALVMLGIVTHEEAYKAIQWRVIFLVAGVIPLGSAIEHWGLAQSLAQTLRFWIGDHPWLLLSAVYFATMVATEFVTHVACAVVMTPLAITIAVGAGLDPRPFCIAVLFATSTSFSTPVGYQTNAMVFGPGGYRFADFARIGIPLNLLFWGLSSALIPVFWPLHGP